MQEELFTAALGLQAPWSVREVQFDPDAGRIDFIVGFERGSHFACPACSAADQGVHDTRSREWRHLNFFQFKAFIKADLPRTRCTSCSKTTQVPAPWAREGSGFTLMFVALTLTLGREMPVLAIARLFGTGDDPLWRIIEHHVDKARAVEDYSDVTRIGIDETATRRGQNYMTTVHDMDGGRVIFATEGRDKKTIARFTEDFFAHGGDPTAITDACTDLSKAYIAGVGQYLPNATLSFDPFHVVALANQAVDLVRRDEVRGEPSLKGTRWCWLKDASRWTTKQLEAFHHLSRAGLHTGRAWRIKEALRDIFATAADANEARVLIERWYSWARRSRLEPFKKLARTIRAHLEGILHHFDSKLSNGRVESINSLVQAAKARARGYRRVDSFIAITYLIAGKLRALPTNPFIIRAPVIT